MAVDIFLKDVKEAQSLLERVHQEYQKYFMGVEKIPPLILRKQLDEKIVTIKAAIAKATTIQSKFIGNQIVSRYQTYMSNWERSVREVENGTFRKPPLKR